jgi:RES domain-containing protein
MRVYRLCRASYPPYDGEGARRAGGRWNSKGARVVYMSENRSLAVLEILVHLSDVLPDKYVLGSADLPDDVSPEVLTDKELPENWATLVVGEQHTTRQLGDEWLRRGNSAVLSVPSVTSGERNFLLNPEHPQFRQINFHDPVLFRFDIRLLRPSEDGVQSPKPTSQ